MEFYLGGLKAGTQELEVADGNSGQNDGGLGGGR